MFILLTLNSSPKHYSGDQIEKNEMSGHVECMGVRRDAYIVWVEMPEGKKALRRIVCRWEDNINMGHHEVG
jgi:hypothetical protein